MKTKKYLTLLVLAGFAYVILAVSFQSILTAQEQEEPNQPITEDAKVIETKPDNVVSELPVKENETTGAKPQYNFVTEPHEVLAGLQGVGVIVEAFQPEAKKYGLTEQDFRKLAESRLRQYGVKVLTGQQQLQTPGRSYLHVSITPVILEDVNSVAVSITVKLNELITLWRNPTTVVMATTWDAGQVMLIEKDNLDVIKETTQNLIDEFINAYLAANPASVSAGLSKAGVITGITYNENKSFAIIGTNIVSEGETIDGIKIIKINKDTVEFEKDGKRWTQGLNESSSLQWK
jgi:hypothetical protein